MITIVTAATVCLLPLPSATAAGLSTVPGWLGMQRSRPPRQNSEPKETCVCNGASFLFNSDQNFGETCNSRYNGRAVCVVDTGSCDIVDLRSPGGMELAYHPCGECYIGSDDCTYNTNCDCPAGTHTRMRDIAASKPGDPCHQCVKHCPKAEEVGNSCFEVHFECRIRLVRPAFADTHAVTLTIQRPAVPITVVGELRRGSTMRLPGWLQPRVSPRLRGTGEHPPARVWLLPVPGNGGVQPGRSLQERRRLPRKVVQIRCVLSR